MLAKLMVVNTKLEFYSLALGGINKLRCEVDKLIAWSTHEFAYILVGSNHLHIYSFTVRKT